MDDNDADQELHLDEYECGERVNSYRLNHRPSAKSASKVKISWISLSSVLHSLFYPDNYPLGVSEDYGIYQYYNILQTGCIAISGALAFSALFRGMGVGGSTSNYLSASIVWLLKDGAGMIGRILFAWRFAASLDANCKRWHFLGDVLNDVACILDLITPYFQSILLLISSISNICRAVTMVIHGSTRTVIFQHQARNNNVADIAAKCSSLETMISLLALIVNVLVLSIVPNQFIWPLFIVLTLGHLWANYKAKRSILFNVFNHQRFHLVCEEYFRSNGVTVLSVEQVNNAEGIIIPTPVPYRLHLGASLNHIPTYLYPSKSQLKTFHNNEHQRFFLTYDQNQMTFYALLKPYADTDDLIRLNFYIEILSHFHRRSTEDFQISGIHSLLRQIAEEQKAIDRCLEIFSANNDQYYEQFKSRCLQHGYSFHRCLFHVDVFRLQ